MPWLDRSLDPAQTARCGFEPSTGLYYEVLGGPDADRTWLFIHGGGATGACFRARPDGRMGWADQIAALGDRCWVTDWPGAGRSGTLDPLSIDYPDLVSGYRELLARIISRPVIVVCHSMGGPVAWKLMELCPDLVAGVVALGPAHPGNIQPVSELLGDDGITVRARFQASGVEFTVRRDRPYTYSDAYVRDQAIATSSRFPPEWLPAFRNQLVPMSPLLVIRRLGLGGGLPRIDDGSSFAGVWIRDFAGTEDPAHTPGIERATVDFLRERGADARLVGLGDRGIHGNGHFFFLENNSDEILELVLTEVAAATGKSVGPD